MNGTPVKTKTTVIKPGEKIKLDDIISQQLPNLKAGQDSSKAFISLSAAFQ